MVNKLYGVLITQGLVRNWSYSASLSSILETRDFTDLVETVGTKKALIGVTRQLITGVKNSDKITLTII